MLLLIVSMQNSYICAPAAGCHVKFVAFVVLMPPGPGAIFENATMGAPTVKLHQALLLARAPASVLTCQKYVPAGRSSSSLAVPEPFGHHIVSHSLLLV